MGEEGIEEEDGCHQRGVDLFVFVSREVKVRTVYAMESL